MESKQEIVAGVLTKALITFESYVKHAVNITGLEISGKRSYSGGLASTLAS